MTAGGDRKLRVWQQLANAPTSRQVPPEDSFADERHSRGIATIHSDGNLIGRLPDRLVCPSHGSRAGRVRPRG